MVEFVNTGESLQTDTSDTNVHLEIIKHRKI